MTKGEQLISRYLNGGMNTQEILAFRQQARDFFQSNAPKEEKEKLSGYMEAVVMICKAIEEGTLKESDLDNTIALDNKKEETLRPLNTPNFLKKRMIKLSKEEMVK